MFFQRLKTPGLGHNSYVLDCGEGLAVVIDPRRGVDEYLRLARESNLSIVYILETHRQEDFEFGSATLAEMTGEHIPGGLHQFAGYLEKDLPQLPKDSEIVVHCSVAHRSGVAANILKRNGFDRVHNMLGGITAWENLDLPLEKPNRADE